MTVDTANSSSTQTRFKVEGMHCASCVSRIEKALDAIPGVTQASVNLATRDATVQFDPDQVSVEVIRRRVGEIGYTAVENTQPTHHNHIAAPPADKSQVRE